MLWLKSLKECPSGEFFYEQNGRRFDRTPLINELARSIVDYRRGNSLPRASYGEVMEDVIRFTVQRLNGDPQWCMETDLSPSALIPQASGGSCAGCGASVS